MWNLYQTAKTWNCRPSELISDLDPLTAFSFDNAVASFGNAVESALKNVTSEAKTQKEADKKYDRELRKWLGLPALYRSPSGPTAR